MVTARKNPRICKQGHHFYKTSDCPTCPICEKAAKPGSGFLSLISAPARRALEREGITTLHQLSRQKETGLLQLHGIGPASLPTLRAALKSAGLKFKK
jgi:hypothetical protein